MHTTLFSASFCCDAFPPIIEDYGLNIFNFNGDPVEVYRAVNGELFIGSSKIMFCNLMATNGIIHHVDRFILPHSGTLETEPYLL